MAGTDPLLRGERLEALLARLPERPGVYLMKAAGQKVVYVGKARSLRQRVRSYFRASGDDRPFVARLDQLLVDIEVVVTPTEKDALILERELIASQRPRFNINLRDDKNFLSIQIRAGHPFPRLLLGRRRPRADEDDRVGRWFGPYTSAASARQTYRVVQQSFRLRTCTDAVFARRTRPCLMHQIDRCLGPCCLPLGEGDYARQVEQAMAFLRGRTDDLLGDLKGRMKSAADQLQYEEAARLRDRIAAVEATAARRRLLPGSQEDLDVLGLHREGGSGAVVLLQVRQGRLMGAARFAFSAVESSSADLSRQFLGQHYGPGADLPPRILLPAESLPATGAAEELPLLSAWLGERRGARLAVEVPRRGARVQLLDLARENAREAFQSRLATTRTLGDRLERLRQRLQLSRFPSRIECFDLSTSAGRFSVGSMAVLIDGEPQPSAYRRYRIRDAAPDSDVDMMREVLTRRFRPLIEADEEGPDLVVLDGGRAQLAVIRTLFADLGVVDVDLVALAKGPPGAGHHKLILERVFIPGRKNPIQLRPDSDELFLLSQIRDEAHRFAIAYHRKLRRKAAVRSVLDDIPGVGPVLRRRLLDGFGSLKGVKGASAEELSRVPGVSLGLAKRIHAFLQGLNP